VPVIASGMIGSRQGWREAPYERAPAGFDGIAAGLLALDDAAGRPWRVVPGVLAVADDGEHEVMRGEETQVFGALAGLPADQDGGLFVLPGSHGKWVRVQARRIVAIRTSLTGEAWAALRDHTLLGRLCADPDPDDPVAQAAAWQAFELGVRQAHAQPGALLHLLFRVRTEGLFGRLRPEQLPAYLSGLLTGAEASDGLAWRGADPSPPVLVGSGAQLQRHARALACLGVTARIAAPDCAATGLHAIASAAGLIDPA
jgi:2-dehydro-3-deoxygalactonokinase